MTRETIDRFWAKVDKTGECWIWTGGRTHAVNGYGSLKIGPFGHNRTITAHRFAYELTFGPVPDGRQLDHLCSTRLCVNPAHLEPVTPQENVRRSSGVTATAARTNTCPRGHSLDDALQLKNGQRRCRECNRARARKAAHR